MDREQFKRLIYWAREGVEWESDQATYKQTCEAEESGRWAAAMEAIAAAREELAKWPAEDEIDETPRIRPEDAEKYMPRD